jgi:hypothetical protein
VADLALVAHDLSVVAAETTLSTRIIFMPFDLMSDPIMALGASHTEVVMSQVIHLNTSR